MRTIPRHRQRKINELKTLLQVCYMHSQGNDFVGTEVEADRAWEYLEKNDPPHVKLYEIREGEKYTVHVHSNLWFELRPEPGSA